MSFFKFIFFFWVSQNHVKLMDLDSCWKVKCDSHDPFSLLLVVMLDFYLIITCSYYCSCVGFVIEMMLILSYVHNHVDTIFLGIFMLICRYNMFKCFFYDFFISKLGDAYLCWYSWCFVEENLFLVVYGWQKILTAIG